MLTREEAIAEILDSRGKIISLEFTKRSTGELRQMLCRTGVTSHLSGGVPAYNREARVLICVYDFQKQAYRSVPIEGITRVKRLGDWEDVR